MEPHIHLQPFPSSASSENLANMPHSLPQPVYGHSNRAYHANHMNLPYGQEQTLLNTSNPMDADARETIHFALSPDATPFIPRQFASEPSSQFAARSSSFIFNRRAIPFVPPQAVRGSSPRVGVRSAPFAFNPRANIFVPSALRWMNLVFIADQHFEDAEGHFFVAIEEQAIADRLVDEVGGTVLPRFYVQGFYFPTVDNANGAVGDLFRPFRGLDRFPLSPQFIAGNVARESNKSRRQDFVQWMKEDNIKIWDGQKYGQFECVDYIHHFNFFGRQVYCKSGTSPAKTIAALRSSSKHMTMTDPRNIRIHTIVKEASSWLDPVIYYGKPEILDNLRGTALEDAVIGQCAKFYTAKGWWLQDKWDEDEDYPKVDPMDASQYPQEHVIINGFTEGSFPTRLDIIATGTEEQRAIDKARKVALLSRLGRPPAQSRLGVFVVTQEDLENPPAFTPTKRSRTGPLLSHEEFYRRVIVGSSSVPVFEDDSDDEWWLDGDNKAIENTRLDTAPSSIIASSTIAAERPSDAAQAANIEVAMTFPENEASPRDFIGVDGADTPFASADSTNGDSDNSHSRRTSGSSESSTGAENGGNSATEPKARLLDTSDDDNNAEDDRESSALEDPERSGEETFGGINVEEECEGIRGVLDTEPPRSPVSLAETRITGRPGLSPRSMRGLRAVIKACHSRLDAIEAATGSSSSSPQPSTRISGLGVIVEEPSSYFASAREPVPGFPTDQVREDGGNSDSEFPCDPPFEQAESAETDARLPSRPVSSLSTATTLVPPPTPATLVPESPRRVRYHRGRHLEPPIFWAPRSGRRLPRTTAGQVLPHPSRAPDAAEPPPFGRVGLVRSPTFMLPPGLSIAQLVRQNPNVGVEELCGRHRPHPLQPISEAPPERRSYAQRQLPPTPITEEPQPSAASTSDGDVVAGVLPQANGAREPGPTGDTDDANEEVIVDNVLSPHVTIGRGTRSNTLPTINNSGALVTSPTDAFSPLVFSSTTPEAIVRIPPARRVRFALPPLTSASTISSPLTLQRALTDGNSSASQKNPDLWPDFNGTLSPLPLSSLPRRSRRLSRVDLLPPPPPPSPASLIDHQEEESSDDEHLAPVPPLPTFHRMRTRRWRARWPFVGRKTTKSTTTSRHSSVAIGKLDTSSEGPTVPESGVFATKLTITTNLTTGMRKASDDSLDKGKAKTARWLNKGLRKVKELLETKGSR